METKSIKLTQLTTWVIFLLIGLFFMLLTLGGTLVPSFYKDVGIGIMIAIPLGLILALEGIVYWISQSIKIDDEKMRGFERKDIVSQASSAYAFLFRYGSLIKNVIFTVILLAFIGFFSYHIVIKPLITEGVVFSQNFYIQMGIYLAWFIIIRRFAMKPLYKVWATSKKSLPSYSLAKDGVIINLKFNQGTFPRICAVISFISGIAAVLIRPYALYLAGVFVLFFILAVSGIGKRIVLYPVKLKFSEIDEIRELSFVETQSLMQYQIGPNITLVAQGAIDMANFLRKKIERPDVCVMMPGASGAKTIAIKGKKIFYLMAVENEDVSDLIKAFKRYK